MDVLEIINELVEKHSVPLERAFSIASQLVNIGARAAPFRPETAQAVAELIQLRASTQGMTEQ